MKASVRTLSIILVSIFVVSILSGYVSHSMSPPVEELESEPVVKLNSQATSPGHVVFGQYISSDNCGHCSKTGGGSDAHHSIKLNHPDEYVYVTYMSASYTDTDTARAGKVGPYNWAWSTSGAPDAYFGDRTDKNQGGANNQYTTYDSLYSSGGGMHSTVNDYGMSAGIYQNGNTYDVSISYAYTGTGTPASNMKLYAALVDKDCTGYSYSSGIPHGYNCWMAWLTAGNTYKSKNAGTGTAFHSVTLSSTEESQSWSGIPTSVVPGGLDKAVVVAVLMSGNTVSVGGQSAHVYHATDSTMLPLVDVGIETVELNNPISTNSGYVPGDTIDVVATIRNNGVEAYSDGGEIEFYYVDGSNEVKFGDTVLLNNLPATGSTQVVSATLDTSNLPPTSWTNTLRVKISDLTADKISSNNIDSKYIFVDLPPQSRTPQVQSNPSIERGDYFYVAATSQITDGIDTNLSTINFNIEVSAAGADAWDSSIVSGGESIMYPDTINEYREFVVEPTMDMASGSYDIRSQAFDSRGQTSDWVMNTDAFSLMNSLPQISQDPITVKVDSNERVSMKNHITDAESPGDISGLEITSTHAAFVAWHADAEEIEVHFDEIQYIGAEPTTTPVEISVFDGTDTSYNSLIFNVIENGQPRWETINRQYVEEGNSGFIELENHVTDTFEDGSPAPASLLMFELMEITPSGIFTASIDETTLLFETIDDDVNGMVTVTVRCSDGVQFSDQEISIEVSPINDAPRIDLSDLENLELQAGVEEVIHFESRISDVDGDVSESFVRVTADDDQYVIYSMLDNTLTLKWDDDGQKTVTMTIEDRYDVNTYEFVVNVVDHKELTASETNDAMVQVIVGDVMVGDEFEASVNIIDDSPTILSMTTTWQLCNSESGICRLFVNYEHDITMKQDGWTIQPFVSDEIMDMGLDSSSTLIEMADEVKLSMIVTNDANGWEWKWDDGLSWIFTEERIDYSSMSDTDFENEISQLEAQIANLQSQIDALETSGEDTSIFSKEIESAQSELDRACAVRSCDNINDAVSGAESDSSSNLMMILAIISIVVILGLLVGLFVTRSGSDQMVGGEVDWSHAVPSMDVQANSMYGGTDALFQQSYAPITPTHQQQPIVPQQAYSQQMYAQPTQVSAPAPVANTMSPPVPASGLPPGWTMEQWNHYGHAYLQQMNGNR